MFRALGLAAAISVLGVSGGRANVAEDDRLRTSATISVERNDPHSSKQLSRPSNPGACFSGSREFVVSWGGKKFLAPCRFIHETLRHLRAVTELAGSQLIFPLRTDHVHLAVPSELWEEKYYKSSQDEMLSAVLWESRLVAVYHATGTLTVADSTGAGAEPRNRPPYDNRQVLGYYDGRVIEFLPAHANALADRYRSVGWFYFLPRRLDEPTAFPAAEFAFDISFDHHLAAECLPAGRAEIRDVRIETDETLDHAECGEPLHLGEWR